jgi:HK97 family phage portal protein
MGLSPIGQHATTVGTGMAALNFGAQWFLDGAHPSGMMTNDLLDEIDDTQAQTMKARFLAAIRGTREPVVLSKGWHYQQLQINPNESQFLETQEYTSAECARVFGPGMPELLGYKVGNSMTYANIEQRAIDLLMFSVDPWFDRFERAISDLLPQPRHVIFDRESLQRTDTKTRYEAFQLALRNGFMVINDVNRKIGQPPVPWGDEPYLPAMGAPAAAMEIKVTTPQAVLPGAPASTEPAAAGDQEGLPQ